MDRQHNGQKDKQRSAKQTCKTKDRVTRTPLKTGGELMFFGRVGSSCPINVYYIKYNVFKYSDYIPCLFSLICTWILQRCLDYEVTMQQAILNKLLCC